ncbi:MAG TPA: hypothetical protein VJT32_03285 [bacterium]|nr:hypothetical protein [bacterium]
MDKDEFARVWPLIRPQVKSRWNKLTDKDLENVQNPELLIGIIQEKYEESRQAIELQIKSLVEHKASIR